MEVEVITKTATIIVAGEITDLDITATILIMHITTTVMVAICKIHSRIILTTVRGVNNSLEEEGNSKFMIMPLITTLVH